MSMFPNWSIDCAWVAALRARLRGALLDCPDQEEQLGDIIVFLLLWGEAANLRFMPEMLCFLFELARAYAAEMQDRG